MKAGFSEIDITPPIGTKKIGWLEDLSGNEILDPLFARIAVYDDGERKIGFVQLDTLSIRWTQVEDIRKRIGKKCRFPAENIMVSATHNHAGPAIAGFHPIPRDEKYMEEMVSKCVTAFDEALSGIQEAELGFATTFNFDLAHNRRCRMRDGTVKSQTPSSNPMFLCLEGPADPEVAVLAVKDKNGVPMGCMVNYACHPVDHGGGDKLSSGFPGLVCRMMKDAGYPVTIYHNGAYGNVITQDFEKCKSLSMEESAESLYKSVQKALAKISFSDGWPLAAGKKTVSLNYRKICDDEYKGRVFGAQRFRSDAMYEEFIDYLKVKIEKEKTKKVEVQVLGIGDIFYAGVPAEYFVEFQLRIKEETYPKSSLVVGGANGMAGYVPTRAAFSRGGYETTLGPPSYLAPESGDIIADTAIKIIKEFGNE